jgi:hypothetical protein
LFGEWKIDEDLRYAFMSDNRPRVGVKTGAVKADSRYVDPRVWNISDWENGDPDSLTLPTVKVEIDRKCSQVSGVTKLCYGNYGDTGWLGINELLIITNRNGETIVSKMKEYYLLNADFVERRYTRFWIVAYGRKKLNSDLGNCLDYTKSPQNNLAGSGQF